VIRTQFIKVTLFYVISIAFILLNVWFVTTKHTLLFNALPFVFLVFLFSIFSFDKLIYIIVFFTPLSVALRKLVPGISFDMYLPTEPVIFGLLILFILKVLHERNFDRKILLHPVTLVIGANLFWIFITSFTSTMPLVSSKFLLARIWFIVVLYLLTVKLFSEGKNMERYVWLYTVPLALVIFYATARLLSYGLWNKQAAHFVMSPFYNDHTSYGAVTAIYLPFLAIFSFDKSYSKKVRLISLFFLGIVLLGLFLSYSRAAWVSVVAAAGVWGIIKLKIRFKTLMIISVSLLFFLILFQNHIFMKLEKNSEESSADFKTHISSISNITTDVSNLERINRWSCAIRMFADKPVFGWGPGTYMFQYAPYQLNRDRTIISTNSATLGNAHSEYLGPLAEQGVFGMLTFLLIVGVVIYTAIHTYSRLTDSRLRAVVLAALISLTTYYVHGFMNNFLDTDKLSVPFWGFTAMIVAIDLYSKREIENKKNPV
jgi:putative inorganic carbon (hco3(-)) transporter